MTRTHDLGTGDPGADRLSDLAAWPDDEQAAHRPGGVWVRSNFVATVDGAAFGPDGRTGSINTDADHRLFDAFRATCDVVVVGAATVRAEGYRGVTVPEGTESLRHRHGRDGAPALVIVSSSLDLPDELTAPDCGPVVVLTGADADDDAVGRIESRGAEVVRTPADEVDAAAVIEVCRQRGWRRVLCEGGPRLHGMLLAAGLVDEVCLTVSPMIVAGEADPIASGPVDRVDLVVARVDVLDDTVFLRWRRS